MNSDALIDEMRDSPELPFVIHKLQAVLESEGPLREKFYDEITEDGKIEFINGSVIVQSPAKLKHIDDSRRLLMLVGAFCGLHKLGHVTHEKALICLTRNDYEPDICFFGPEKASQLHPDQLKFPAPDWVCEVLSETTQRIDRGVKYQDYALHGIREYWIVDPDKELVEIHLLAGQKYRLEQIVSSGELESRVITGFKIPVRAIFDTNAATEALRYIMQAPAA